MWCKLEGKALLGNPGEQLRLFAPASEIVQGLYGGEIGSHETDLYTDDGRLPIPGSPAERDAHIRMMNHKKDEAWMPAGGGHGSGVAQSIGRDGFQGHIQLDVSADGARPKLWEGHHRLGAAHDLGEQFVGLDYITPNKPGTPDQMRSTGYSYESRYPQSPNWGSTANPLGLLS